MKQILMVIAILLSMIAGGCDNGVKFCLGCKERELREPKGEELFSKRTAVIAIASVDTAKQTGNLKERKAIKKALKKFKRFRHRVKKKDQIVIINFDLPYTAKRMIIYDLKKKQIVKRTTTAHAYKSGKLYAKVFSNVPESRLSSLGAFVTGRDFDGTHGYSLRLYGLERGLNHNARARGIIFHPRNGQTHSLGCFLLDDTDAYDLIELMKNKMFVYVYKS
jgi:hypothetical protein